MKYLLRSAIIGLGLLSVNPALADTVHLKNGDRLSGAILSKTESGGLRFAPAFGGAPVNIPWDQVEALIAADGSAVTPPAPPPPPQQAATPVAEIEIVETTIVETTTTEKPPRSRFLNADWSGRVNLGAGLHTGNSDKENFNADGRLSGRWEDHRLILRAEYNWERDEGLTTVNNWSQNSEYDYFFAPQWFLNSHLGFKQDDIAGLDLRTIAGIGLGHQAYESDALNLRYVFGPTILRENYQGESPDTDIALRWALDYDQKFWNGRVQPFHNHLLLVPADETSAFVFESRTGMRVPIHAGIIGTAEIQFDWDNAPAAGATEEDVIYTIKLGYEW